jgi:putative colanic acid biosynthesis UDP-glucose lipid carrier transferase
MRTREFILLFFIVDTLLLNTAIVLTAAYRGANLDGIGSDELTIILNVSAAIIYLVFIDDMKCYKTDLWKMIRSLFHRFSALIATAAIITISAGIDHFSRIQLLGSIMLFTFNKFVVSLFLFHRMALKNNGGCKVVIVGDDPIARQIYRYCSDNPYLGYEPIGMLTDANTKSTKNVLGTISDFQRIYDHVPFDVAIISLPLHETEKIGYLIHLAEKNGVRPRLVPNWYTVIHRNFTVNSLGNIPMLDIRNVPLYHYPNRFWKRAFDLAIAGGTLLFLSPFLILVALAIKLQDGGPVFYTPIRLGVNNRPFKLYKFRSMSVNDNAQDGTRSTVLNDERITRLGKFLRRSNVDELPQLFNVLLNEMSIIGPRPHRVYLNKTLQQKLSTYMVRHSIKPGITGWAQVHGWRGPTESRIQYIARTLHDLWYIEHWSFAIDFYIIFLTAFGKKTNKNAF